MFEFTFLFLILKATGHQKPTISTKMSQDLKIRAELVQYLMKEGYDGKFIHELLQKWKSENVSVKDGLKKLLHPSY